MSFVRFLRIYYLTDGGKERLLNLNELYFNPGDLERLLRARADA